MTQHDADSLANGRVYAKGFIWGLENLHINSAGVNQVHKYMSYFNLCFWSQGFHYVFQAGLELKCSCLCFPGAGKTGMCHHTQLCPFKKKKNRVNLFNFLTQ